jgi:Ca2+-binding RTX toxin-like protein
MKQGIAIAVVLAALSASTAFGAGPAARVSIGFAGGGNDARASALQLGVTGSPEPEEISVTLDGTQTQYVITSTRPINPPPPPCVQISTFQITCPTADFVSFDATLGGGNDNFTVGPSVDVPVTMSGGTGLDSLRGGSGTDTMAGGLGADRLLGNNGADTLRGGKGGDVLKGGRGRDLLNGGKGGDSLRGGPGRDIEKQ